MRTAKERMQIRRLLIAWKQDLERQWQQQPGPGLRRVGWDEPEWLTRAIAKCDLSLVPPGIPAPWRGGGGSHGRREGWDGGDPGCPEGDWDGRHKLGRSWQQEDLSTVVARCYVQLKPGPDSFFSHERTEQTAAAFENLGFSVIGRSRFHLGISADLETYCRIFQTSVEAVPDPRGNWFFFTEEQRIPSCLLTYVEHLVMGGPVKHLSPFGWPDPSADFVADYLQGHYNFKGDYGLYDQNGLPNLLFYSDVRKLHDMNALHLQGFQGQGVTIFMLDSGVDLSQDFFAGNPSVAAKVSFLGCYDDEVELLSKESELTTDWEGHGTMCASAALNMAPEANLVMVTRPVRPTILPYGTMNLQDFLAGLAKTVDMALEAKPALISLSVGLTKALLVEVGMFAHTVTSVRTLLQIAADCGVMTYASTGNEEEDEELVPGQMDEVISVGGAYPETLDPKTWCWVVSSHSLSGRTGAPLSLKPHGRPFPDLCGTEGTRTEVVKTVVNSSPSGLVAGLATQTEKFGKVGICLPVCHGLTQAEVDTILRAHLPPGLATTNPWLYSIALVNLLLAMPLDYKASVNLHDWTEPNDGWAVDSGGTSFATAVVAGIVAAAMSKYPAFSEGESSWTALQKIEHVRAVLAECCLDVAKGVSAGGHVAQPPGLDLASGSGVLNAYALAEYLDYVQD